MKKDWFAAIVSFPSAILEGIGAFVREVELDEKEALAGSEYDPEADES